MLSLINLILLLFIHFSYFILLSRLQKKMKHLILLFLLFLAPAFAESQRRNQNYSSNNASHKRLKRDWIWNQMHIKEEIDTQLPHHVGKVNSSLLAMNN